MKCFSLMLILLMLIGCATTQPSMPMGSAVPDAIPATPPAPEPGPSAGQVIGTILLLPLIIPVLVLVAMVNTSPRYSAGPTTIKTKIYADGTKTITKIR
jgi:hypothetical protein